MCICRFNFIYRHYSFLKLSFHFQFNPIGVKITSSLYPSNESAKIAVQTKEHGCRSHTHTSDRASVCCGNFSSHLFSIFFFVNLGLEKTNSIVEVGRTLAGDQMLPSMF